MTWINASFLFKQCTTPISPNLSESTYIHISDILLLDNMVTMPRILSIHILYQLLLFHLWAKGFRTAEHKIFFYYTYKENGVSC